MTANHLTKVQQGKAEIFDFGEAECDWSVCLNHISGQTEFLFKVEPKWIKPKKIKPKWIKPKICLA
jgi:hypothetical protein